ncbi:hypothetical protein DFH07DRAFT_1032430 [Mycena maculata]|uniref:Uncharacterized protein n=1 Tax=Mycena maculata TaxID=230809 RepID=A0AAD7IX26_9AGAR|nr:hypothetical protein DFH07DRAFT_1032430 [Mycena maculata]
MQPMEGSNTTYFVDVGAAAHPMLLADGEVVRLAPTSKGPRSLSGGSSPSKDPTQPKISRVLYSFIDDEFFDADYKAVNYSVLGLTAGRFWENVVRVKFFWISNEAVRSIDDTADPATLTPLTRYMGWLAMAGNAVRSHIGTQMAVLREMKTEVERADALKEFFGIDIPHEDLKHTRSRAKLKVRTSEKCDVDNCMCSSPGCIRLGMWDL